MDQPFTVNSLVGSANPYLPRGLKTRKEEQKHITWEMSHPPFTKLSTCRFLSICAVPSFEEVTNKALFAGTKNNSFCPQKCEILISLVRFQEGGGGALENRLCKQELQPLCLHFFKEKTWKLLRCGNDQGRDSTYNRSMLLWDPVQRSARSKLSFSLLWLHVRRGDRSLGIAGTYCVSQIILRVRM